MVQNGPSGVDSDLQGVQFMPIQKKGGALDIRIYESY